MRLVTLSPLSFILLLSFSDGQNFNEGCCVSFGYGAMMKPCCYNYRDNATESSCASQLLGGGVVHYPATGCSEVQAGCCVTYGYGVMMTPCCHQYEDNVLVGRCQTTLMGQGAVHYPGNTCPVIEALTDCKRKQLLEQRQCSGMMGCQITQCESNGQFTPMQCGAGGFCWCVDAVGVKIGDGRRDMVSSQCALGCCAITSVGTATQSYIDGESAQNCVSDESTFYSGLLCEEVETNNTRAVGCCEKFGYGAMMKPCCHIFEDAMTSETCVSGGIGGGATLHPGMFCSQVKRILNMTTVCENQQQLQCTGTGAFSPKQYDSITNETWCVDDSGMEVANTRMKKNDLSLQLSCEVGCCMSFGYGSNMKPCCHNYEDGVLSSKCVKSGLGSGVTHFAGETCGLIQSSTDCEKRSYLDQVQCGGAYGCFSTSCRPDGSFSPKQCHAGTGYCWCVDGNGMKIFNSDSPPGVSMQCQDLGCCVTFGYGSMMKPCCHEYTEAVLPTSCAPHGLGGGSIHYPTLSCTAVLSQTDCQKRRSLEEIQCAGKLGCRITQCDANGGFSPKQCHANYCWCVDSIGRIRNQTMTIGTSINCQAGCCESTSSMTVDDTLEATCLHGSTPSKFWPGMSCGNLTRLQLTPCFERSRKESAQCTGMTFGCFVTQCRDDGAFVRKQCHDSTGYCWCVDNFGTEIIGSKTPPTSSVTGRTSSNLNCSSFQTVCQETRLRDDAACGGFGCFKTQCLMDGSFASQQCHGSYCWCVDKLGKEITGTSTTIGLSPSSCEVGCCMTYGYGAMMEPCCANYEDDVVKEQCTANGLGGGSNHYTGFACVEVEAHTECEQTKRNDQIKCGGLLGCFITSCQSNGAFSPKQCLGSSCWCVDGHGMTLNETQWLLARDCNSFEYGACELEKSTAVFNCGSQVGCFIPQCLADGQFNPIQCNGGTGFCWCVDLLGNELTGTSTRGTPTHSSCRIPDTPCQVKKNVDIRRCTGVYGCFITQCDAFGGFSRRQSDTTGYSWCVDVNGTSIEGTITKPGEDSVNCGACAAQRSADVTACGGMGCFTTECLDDTRFNDRQCFGSVCWCVDSRGQSMNHTYSGIWEQRSCTCERQRADELAKCSGRFGCFISQCEPDGSYQPQQCHGATCWCVDSKGIEFGFRGSRSLNCYTPCLQKLASEIASCGGQFGCKKTLCEPDGSFSPKQCHGSSCWCVDLAGTEIDGTSGGMGDSRPCACDRQRSIDDTNCGGYGCFKTQCESDGLFSPRQCHGSVCSCVNSYSGKEVGVTSSGTMDLNCETPCQIQRVMNINNCGGFGCLTTQCEPDGSFSAQQCHGSLCWCVTSDGFAINGTKAIRGKYSSCACAREQSDYKEICGGFGCRETICDEDWTFSPEQCFGNDCWCVDSNGNKLTACTPCLRKRALDQVRCSGMFGCPITQCEDDGSFAPKQCFGSGCYCVNNTGGFILGTSHNIWESRICSCQYQSYVEKAKCGGRMGCYNVVCMPDGSFEPRQCQGSKCWCVDAIGQHIGIEGTYGLVCGETCARRQIEDDRICNGGRGCFRTRCDSSGGFALEQCLGSRCWCADIHGKEISGTEASIGSLSNMNCACVRRQMEDRAKCSSSALLQGSGVASLAVPTSRVGCFIMKCQANGSFAQVQCQGSVCWCTNDMTGIMEGSSHSIGPLVIDCSSTQSTACERQVNVDDNNCGGFGCFKTSCKSDGSFSAQQCFGSDCWCVDMLGKKINGTTTARDSTINCLCYQSSPPGKRILCGTLSSPQPTSMPATSPTPLLNSHASDVNANLFRLFGLAIFMVCQIAIF